ncbi:hypothetical protein NBRC116600_13540 [Thalassotalea sp. SU-HH00458]
MESAIELYMAAIPFTDDNLKQCLEEGINTQGVTTSKELTNLACSVPITNVHGLHYFSQLETLDLTNADMSCLAIDEMQTQIIERAAVDEDESITQVIQPAGCFYNQIAFNDMLLKACVAEEVALNGWVNNEEVNYLSCSEPAINDVTGLENFINLAQLDLSLTAVPCIDLSHLQTALPNTDIVTPSTCLIDNIVFSQPVQTCVDGQAPESGLVVDFHSLTCNSPEITDLTGLDKLTSLATLNLVGTSVDCDELGELGKVLINTSISKPLSCEITPETLLSDLPPFEDPIMAACIYKKGNENAVTVGDIVVLNCGATTGVPDKELTSLGGLENLVSMQSLIINATKVDSFQPLKDHPSLKVLSIFNLKRLNNDDMVFVHENMTYLENFNMGGATGMKDYAKFNAMTNLNFLGLANQNLTGDDLGTVGELIDLKTLNIKANKLTTLEALHSLTGLTELNVTKNPNLSCDQINAFKAAVPDANVLMDQGC